MIAGWINESIFLVTALMVLGGGALAILARSLIHGVLGLIVSLMGVAGLYFQLGSPFLFTMQILIYVGAICIIIVFAVMLAEPGGKEPASKRGVDVLLGLLAGLISFVVMISVLRSTAWVPASVRAEDSSLQAVGTRILLDYGLVFEVISLVLLVAIMGAIVLARGGRGTR